MRFQDAFEAHKLGPKMRKIWRIGETGVMCTSNEQICLNEPWMGQDKGQTNQSEMDVELLNIMVWWKI